MFLASELTESKLIEAQAALNALHQGETVSKLFPSLVTEQLIATYRIRAEHVAAKQTPHWDRLGKSTFEFVANIQSLIGQTGEWLHIGVPGGNGFMLYRLPTLQQIVGCMYVMPSQEDGYADE